MEIDEIDRKILFELDLDCRVTQTEIAQKFGMYPSTIRKRILSLEKQEIIKGYSLIINTRRIGYITYNAFVQFSRITSEQEKAFREFLRNDPHVSFMISLLGSYNLMVTIKAKSATELDDFVDVFWEKYGENILRFDICTHRITYFLPKKYLLTDVPSKVPLVPSPEVEETLTLSPVQQGILQELKKDSRKTSVDIGHALNIDPRTVTEHIGLLQELGVIKKFLPLIRIRPLGYTWYLCIIKLRRKSKLLMQELLTLIIAHPNLVFIAEGRGEWDFMIDIHCKGHEQCADIVREIRNHLMDDITEIQVMTVLDRLKHEFVLTA